MTNLPFELPRLQNIKIQVKSQNFILLNTEKQMVPCKSTAEEVSFEWSHHRISSTGTKVGKHVGKWLAKTIKTRQVSVLANVLADFSVLATDI